MFFGTRQSWVSAVFRDDFWVVCAAGPTECRSAISSVLRNTFLASSRAVVPQLFRGGKVCAVRGSRSASVPALRTVTQISL